MKVNTATCAAILATALLASPSWAVIDDFSTYAAGDIAGQSGPTPPWTAGETWDTADTGAAATISGNGLQISPLGAGDRGNAWRRYDDSLFSFPYSINFDVTLDELDAITAGGFQGADDTNAGDYLNIFERGGDDGDFGGNGSWLLRGGRLNPNGAEITRGTATNSNENAYNASSAFNWYVMNYDPLVANGFTDVDVVDTGIGLVEGTSYDITVSFLGGGQWNVLIDDGSSVYDSATSDGPFGFRSASELPRDGSEAPAVHWGFADAGSETDSSEALQLTLNRFGTPDPFIPGDVDGDGDVDIDDFAPILQFFAQDVTSRDQGDLDGNGFVDLYDFTIWKDIFVSAGGSLEGLDLGPFSTSVAPEPATLSLVCAAGIGVCLRRRSRR